MPLTNLMDVGQYVQQGFEQGRERGTNTRLNQLAGQAYGANPQDQRALVQQAIQTDRGQGMALGNSLNADRDAATKRLAQKAGMVAKIHKANPQMAGGMYAGLAQEAAQLFPDMQFSPQLDDATAGLLEQFSQAYGTASGDTIQSQKISDDGFIVNTYRSGRMEKTGQKVDRQAWFRDHEGMQPEIVGKDGSVRTVGGPQQPPVPQPPAHSRPQFVGPDGLPIDVSQIEDPAIRASILSNADAWQAAPDGSSATLPPVDRSPSQYGQPHGGGMRRPSAAENARAVEQAKVDVQMGALPQELGLRGNAAVGQAAAIAENAAGIDRQGAARTKAPQLMNVERGITRIDAAMKALEGGMVNTGPVDQLAMRWTEAGQELEAAVGSIKNDMLALTRVPGVGSQSDLEQRIADLKYPAIGNHPEVNRRNLEQLTQFRIDLENSISGNGGQDRAPSTGVGAPIPVRSAADYSAVPSGAEYMAPDGSIRRKK